MEFFKNKQKSKNNKNQTHRYREQIGGCQSWREWGEMAEGGQKVQTSSYKIKSHGDLICSMVTIVGNTVLYI